MTIYVVVDTTELVRVPLVDAGGWTALATSYRSQLEERLGRVGALVLSLPKVSHSDILDRDLEVRKPFRQNGKGYRDALIWETILEFAETCGEASTIYFVTDNTSAFCAPSDASLASELKNEALLASEWVIGTAPGAEAVAGQGP